MQFIIKNSKGKRERYVGLSPVLLDIMAKYYEECKPNHLFISLKGSSQVPNTKCGVPKKYFKKAKEKAGIRKETGFYNFVTYLLEKEIVGCNLWRVHKLASCKT